MAKKTMTDFEKAEALGEVNTLPFDDTPALQEVPDEIPVSNNTLEFQMAIGNAQMEGLEYVEVSEQLFNFLLRKSKSRYITYGDPGIKVFKVGTREDIEQEESLSAEEYHEVISKRKQAERAKSK